MTSQRAKNRKSLPDAIRELTGDFWLTADVQRISGASKRELQWWDGIIKARHVAHSRIYSRTGVFLALLLKELARRRCFRKDRKQIVARIMRSSISETPIVVISENVRAGMRTSSCHPAKNTEEALAFVKESSANRGCHLIDLSELAAKIK